MFLVCKTNSGAFSYPSDYQNHQLILRWTVAIYERRPLSETHVLFNQIENPSDSIYPGNIKLLKPLYCSNLTQYHGLQAPY